MEDQFLSAVDAKLAEQQELETLLEKGLYIDVDKQSLLRYFGKPTRRFLFKQAFLGTLDALSAEYLQTGFDVVAFQADLAGESNRLVQENALRVARIIAIAWLNSQWGIKLFTPLMAWYFRWHLTPRTLLKLTLLIFKLSNLSDFISSIGLMSSKRTTMPVPMEEKPATPSGAITLD